MVRALPYAVPPRMYRHFALVTVLLTAGIAMFADGENRQAEAAAPVAAAAASPPRSTATIAPTAQLARRPEPGRRRPARAGGGSDVPFGLPTDQSLGSFQGFFTTEAADIARAGYSEAHMASLDADERELLLEGLRKEGLLAPDERERRSASLIAASHLRGGGTPGAY